MQTKDLADDPPRVLVRSRIQELGLSMADISRRIGRAPGFISEFLNKRQPMELKPVDRIKLATILKVPPTQLQSESSAKEESRAREIAFGTQGSVDFSQAQWPPGEATVSEGELVPRDKIPALLAPMLQAAGKHAEMWRLVVNRIGGANYLKNDYLIVDMAPNADRTGRVVLATVATDGKTIPIFRLYLPERLFTVYNQGMGESPLEVDHKNVMIRGVVVASGRV